MAEGLRIEGTEEWRRCAVDLKAAADKDLLKAVRKAIRDLAKPVGRFVLERGAESMPASGGLTSTPIPHIHPHQDPIQDPGAERQPE